jgi:hypothetical protein
MKQFFNEIIENVKENSIGGIVAVAGIAIWAIVEVSKGKQSDQNKDSEGK